MKNYIYTNCQLILNKMYFIVNNSRKYDKLNKCPICSKIFKKMYKNKKFKILEYKIHLLSEHNLINKFFYIKLMEHKIDNYPISWYKMTTNNINIIDGLYRSGGTDIYIKTNNFYGKTIFSEHAGFINFKDNKVDDMTILTDYRVDVNDSSIFLPENSLKAYDVNYIFHTHPATPFIGSRIIYKIIYEFPSISDIGHFVEHHNEGKLDGSLIVTPEGIYIIRKNNFNKNKIKIDYELIVPKLSEIYRSCYRESTKEYSDIKMKKIDDEIKIDKTEFYKKIAINFKYINKINEFLSKNDIYVDYYPRINLKKNTWVFQDIYVPFT
jgi:hypothetical protein